MTGDPVARDPFSWRFVTPMLLGSALNPVNSSLIATALVPIAAALHVPVGRTAVLVSVLGVADHVLRQRPGHAHHTGDGPRLDPA